MPPPVAHRGDGRLDAGSVARARSGGSSSPAPVGSGGVWPVPSPSPGTGSFSGRAGGARRAPPPAAGPRTAATSSSLEAAEGAAAVGPAEDGDLEVVGRERAVGPGQGGDRGARGRSARSRPGAPRLAQALGDGLGLAAEHAEAVLVDDGAVVEDVEQLVVGLGGADLGHEDLDLHRLHLVGEDLAEDLGVLVGQAAGVDVLAAERVALQVGVADAGDAELVELVVVADAGEGDAVVDLADLAQRVRRVLGAR